MLCRCKESAKQTLHPKINSLRKVVLRWCFASPVATKLRVKSMLPSAKRGFGEASPKKGIRRCLSAPTLRFDGCINTLNGCCQPF